MATLGIDGLASGLDTTSLIDSLMAVEANQQTLLKTKQSTASSLVTALQALNAKVSSLASSAATAAKPASWAALSATSSSTAVTATASTSAQASTLSFTVDSVAAAQSSLLTLPTDYSGTPSFTITHGSGGSATTTTVNAATGSIADLLAAFNAEGTGVKASAINVGTSAAPSYKLQLTATESGSAHAFSVSYQADDAGTPVTKAAATLEVRAASDATITLFAGTPAAQQITSTSNTFTGLATGVDVTVTATSTDPVTVTVAKNTAAIKSLASGLVSNLNVVLSEITSRTASTTSTADDGGTVVKGGLFSGDTQVRLLQQSILSEASLPVDGTSPSSVGIVINKDGTFTFDDAKFTAAMAADPAAVQKVVSGVAARLESVATTASSSTIGTLTQRVTAEQDVVKDLDKRISDWDDRLAARRESLVKIYAALEVSMSNMQATSTWLTSQIESLSSSSSS